MPGRKLREVPAQRVVRAFEKAGFRIERVAGSHYILSREGSTLISIPRHGAVKTGLLMAKIKSASMSYEEFEDLL